MSAIEEKTILKIKTYDGDIKIPFISLETLDEFTVRYKNREELINSLLSMLNISIDRGRIIDAFVYYEYVKKDQVRYKNVRIKYSKDNFDKDRLIEYVKDFFNRNHEMIKYSGVRKIRSKGMYEFLKGERDIEKYEIDDVVNKYFDGAPYGVYRKNYFFLVDNGVKPVINRVVFNDKNNFSRQLSKFHSDDEYVQSILRSVLNDGDESKVFDELSRIDLEELRGVLTNTHFGLFDGSDNDKAYTLEDLYDLEQCTGMDIDELCDCVSNFGKGPGR